MELSISKNIIQEILQPADIKLNGNNPWDLKIKDKKFYKKIFNGGRLGLGESYMAEWWDCDRLDDFFYKILPTYPEKRLKKNVNHLFYILKNILFNAGSKKKAFEVGEKHYNLGNELFQNMLDKRMVYSCGYWKNAKTLDDAQEAKLDLVCKKIGLKQGDRILDIGCGWGSFAKYAAEKYKARVVGMTVSEEQVVLAKKMCMGLPIEIRLQDYRDINDKFDHIISIGMFEHVGYKNYHNFMRIINNCLKDTGLFLLHTIGNNQTCITNDQWYSKYIFPNYHIPSIKQISTAIEGLFVVEDWHNFGADYDLTLTAWFNNFNEHWDNLSETYDKRFYRMWKYYLLSCAGAFRARYLQLWQIVFSKKGVTGGYLSVR
ncbi:cyclopropane fatty acyl phospholipid synthase [Candidatus Desantisbacteria bacterium]|nr:cyclopropane fatty acyl phospholipid synthase [Candidatus Desantisbacteria bacterium]